MTDLLTTLSDHLLKSSPGHPLSDNLVIQFTAFRRKVPRVARKASSSFSTLSLPGLSMITVYDQRRGVRGMPSTGVIIQQKEFLVQNFSADNRKLTVRAVSDRPGSLRSPGQVMRRKRGCLPLREIRSGLMKFSVRVADEACVHSSGNQRRFCGDGQTTSAWPG